MIIQSLLPGDPVPVLELFAGWRQREQYATRLKGILLRTGSAGVTAWPLLLNKLAQYRVCGPTGSQQPPPQQPQRHSAVWCRGCLKKMHDGARDF